MHMTGRAQLMGTSTEDLAQKKDEWTYQNKVSLPAKIPFENYIEM